MILRNVSAVVKLNQSVERSFSRCRVSSGRGSCDHVVDVLLDEILELTCIFPVAYVEKRGRVLLGKQFSPEIRVISVLAGKQVSCVEDGSIALLTAMSRLAVRRASSRHS